MADHCVPQHTGPTTSFGSFLASRSRMTRPAPALQRTRFARC